MQDLIRKAFGAFFAEANLVRGHEKTFHALFGHHLVLTGVPFASVLREARYDGAPVDIVIRSDLVVRSTESLPRIHAAFEFKGGAYGVRNALAETITPDGYCSDMEKLGWFLDRSIPAWFVCIDIAELGVCFGADMRSKVAAQCAARGIGFAYFCQGETHYLLAEPGGELGEHAIRDRSVLSPTQCELPALDGLLRSRMQMLLTPGIETEDDFALRAYHAIRSGGYSATQVSLETYFSFARKQSQMPLRPDLCVFDASINGRFNLYRHGRTDDCNDARKLKALEALIEVKSLSGASMTSSRRFAQLLLADLEKLGQWRSLINDACMTLGVSRANEPALLLMVFTTAAAQLPAAVLCELSEMASRLGVRFLNCCERDLDPAGQVGALIDQARRWPWPANLATDLSQHDVPAPKPRFFKLVPTPTGSRELATYLAAIFAATGMDKGGVFPLTRFLSNFSTHVDEGRIARVEGGYQLTRRGMDFFEARFTKSRGGAIDRVEVAEMAQRIQTGGTPGWIAI
jgi:hypothetical protein